MPTPFRSAGRLSAGAFFLLSLAWHGCGRPAAIPSPLRLEAKQFHRNEQGVTLHLEWLDISAPSSLSTANEWIKACVTGGRTPDEMFANLVRDRGNGPEWEIDHRVTVLYQSPRELSLNCVQSRSVGGADPAVARVELATFEFARGTRLTLQSVVYAGKEELLIAAGERAFRKSRKIPESKTLAEAGFRFTEGRFHLTQNFCLTGRGMVFQFNPGEIAPEPAGVIELVIPPAEIRPVLRPEAAVLVGR